MDTSAHALAGAIWLVTRTTPSACAEVSMRRVAKVPGLFEKNFLEKNRRWADRAVRDVAGFAGWRRASCHLHRRRESVCGSLGRAEVQSFTQRRIWGLTMKKKWEVWLVDDLPS